MYNIFYLNNANQQGHKYIQSHYAFSFFHDKYMYRADGVLIHTVPNIISLKSIFGIWLPID